MLNTCYGSNAVCHMMSGKAFSRAQRGFLLVDAALTALLIRLLLTHKEQHDSEPQQFSEQDVMELDSLYEEVFNSTTEVSHELMQFMQSLVLHRLDKFLTELKMSLAEGSRTAKLWLQICNLCCTSKP